MTHDLDLTPGDIYVCAFCVASTCHLSSRRVVRGLFFTSKKITLFNVVIIQVLQ